MSYNPEKHHRRSIRLKGYDYSSPGAYFITLCTQNREYLFGKIVDGRMMLNEWGELVNVSQKRMDAHINDPSRCCGE